jgi:hypothetical protein
MKFLRLLILALTAGIVFSSCQKELSAETGTALGTLAKDAAGDCAPIGINGAYKKDTVLSAANFVDVQLDVTQVGIYIISTDTVNGYYFRATGVTPLPGANSIRLVGFGKPITVGTDVFTVKFGGTACEFNVNVTLGTGGGGGTTAVFTFPNAAACTGATQTPNFYVGLPTNPAINTMTLLVNVTQAGTYNLTTTSAGGLIFSGTGSLAVGNNQPIILGASGTPGPTAGTINYTFSTTTPVASSCGFGLTVQAAPTPAIFTINCGTAATQTGTFQAGTALTLANKITLSVTPATIGSYSITTTIVNGVSYVGAGIFTTTATQNVDLFANPLNNTPTTAGSFNYTTTGGIVPCTNVSVTYTGAPTAATYTINCATAATQTGTFVAGTALPATSKITLSVTPATTGSYTITTNIVNGVSYIGTGNFTNTTTQNVNLFASPTNNTPIAAQTSIYTTTGGTTPCTNVSVTYTSGGGGGGGATDTVSATINGVFVDFDLIPAIQMDNNASFPGYTAVVISSDNSLVFPEAIQFGVGNMTTGDIPVGTYNVNQGPAILVGGQYTDGGSVDFISLTGNSNPTPAFSVTITSKTGPMGASGTRVKGTFTGALKEVLPGTGIKQITGGYFDLTFP